MKIHELIEKLQQFNQNAEVKVQIAVVDEEDGCETFTDMDIGKIWPSKPKLRQVAKAATITLQ